MQASRNRTISWSLKLGFSAALALTFTGSLYMAALSCALTYYLVIAYPRHFDGLRQCFKVNWRLFAYLGIMCLVSILASHLPEPMASNARLIFTAFQSAFVGTLCGELFAKPFMKHAVQG